MVLTAPSGTIPIIVSAGHASFSCIKREKKGSTIQYNNNNNPNNFHSPFHLGHQATANYGNFSTGYRKCGTHARVFSQTLAHGNSKNGIRQRHTKKVRREACMSMERSTAGTKERSPDGL